MKTPTCDWPISDSESIEFHIQSLDEGLLDVGCVYIFARLSEGDWLPLCIGQVPSAKALTSNHPYVPIAYQYGATHLHLKGMTSPSERKRLVRSLVQHLQPPINNDFPGFADA